VPHMCYTPGASTVSGGNSRDEAPGPGPRWTNAVIESWHSTLEFELRAVEHFTTKAAAWAKVAAWIKDYNTCRRHSACQMMPPFTDEKTLAA
jgi:putative transposase